jgi:hypothetical protein
MQWPLMPELLVGVMGKFHLAERRRPISRQYRRLQKGIQPGLRRLNPDNAI